MQARYCVAGPVDCQQHLDRKMHSPGKNGLPGADSVCCRWHSGPGPKNAHYIQIPGESNASRAGMRGSGQSGSGASLMLAMRQRAQTHPTGRQLYHIVLYGNTNPSPGTGGVKNSAHHSL
jgi:hypothetical protein